MESAVAVVCGYYVQKRKVGYCGAFYRVIKRERYLSAIQGCFEGGDLLIMRFVRPSEEQTTRE